MNYDLEEFWSDFRPTSKEPLIPKVVEPPTFTPGQNIWLGCLNQEGIEVGKRVSVLVPPENPRVFKATLTEFNVGDIIVQVGLWATEQGGKPLHLFSLMPIVWYPGIVVVPTFQLDDVLSG